MSSTVRAALLLLTLLVAGCTSPEATEDDGATPTGGAAATPTTVSTTPVGSNGTGAATPAAAASPFDGLLTKGGEPCAMAKARQAQTPSDPRLKVEAEATVRRAEVAAAQQGLANARRYLAACIGPAAPEGPRLDVVLQVRNGTGAPTTTLDETERRIVIAIQSDGEAWRAPAGMWPSAVEQPRLAAREAGRAWQLAWGCRDATAIPWLHEGFAEHVAYSASLAAGDLSPQDSYPHAWRLLRAAGGLEASLAGSPSPALAGIFATEAVLRVAPEGGAAMRAYCQALAGGTPAPAAFERAFGVTLAQTEAFWEEMRETDLFEPQAGSPRSFGAAPAKRPAACLATVGDEQEPPLRANASAGVSPAQVAAIERAAATAEDFVSTCYGLTLSEGTLGRLRLNVLDTGEGKMGGSSWMMGDQTGIEIGLDVAHPHWKGEPQELPAGASNFAQVASLFATAVVETNDCRPMNGQLPAWLREGLLQYAGWSSAIQAGIVDDVKARAFLWSAAGHGGALGVPLRDMEQYGGSGPWPGHVGFFVAERLLAESEGGPAAVAAFCGALRQGASVPSAFASGFGVTYDSVAGEPAWVLHP